MKQIERNQETSHMPKAEVIRILTQIIGIEPIVSDYNRAKRLNQENNAAFLKFYLDLSSGKTSGLEELISSWEQASDKMSTTATKCTVEQIESMIDAGIVSRYQADDIGKKSERIFEIFKGHNFEVSVEYYIVCIQSPKNDGEITEVIPGCRTASRVSDIFRQMIKEGRIEEAIEFADDLASR